MKLKTRLAIFAQKLAHWWYQHPRYIMLVQYDVQTNRIECKDWISKRIKLFCGELTPELWDEIKDSCYLEADNNKDDSYYHNPTHIYIWAGMQEKHLAHGEPIDNYLDDMNLLKTGQGFDFKSGLRYGEKSKPKCPTCKRVYN